MKNSKLFENIYISNFEKLKRFAFHYLQNEEDAENIVQDVFEIIWKKREELQEDEDYLCYLLQLVKNKCIDFFRKKTMVLAAHNKLYNLHIHEKAALYSLEQFNPEFSSEKDLMSTINKAIKQLPPQCKEVFYKSKIQGKKQQEIAKEMHITINTVESQMGIAYKKLRILLKDLYPVIFLFF